jgi:hypothetical protein
MVFGNYKHSSLSFKIVICNKGKTPLRKAPTIRQGRKWQRVAITVAYYSLWLITDLEKIEAFAQKLFVFFGQNVDANVNCKNLNKTLFLLSK